MTQLKLSCISNCINDSISGHLFDDIFGRYQKCIRCDSTTESDPDSLNCIYVCFEYDGDWDNATRGERIRRYSRKYRDIQANIEIKGDETKNKHEQDIARMLSIKLIRVLENIQRRLEGKVSHNIPEIIRQIKTENDGFKTKLNWCWVMWMHH